MTIIMTDARKDKEMYERYKKYSPQIDLHGYGAGSGFGIFLLLNITSLVFHVQPVLNELMSVGSALTSPHLWNFVSWSPVNVCKGTWVLLAVFRLFNSCVALYCVKVFFCRFEIFIDHKAAGRDTALENMKAFNAESFVVCALCAEGQLTALSCWLDESAYPHYHWVARWVLVLGILNMLSQLWGPLYTYYKVCHPNTELLFSGITVPPGLLF
jgi:hypothetical protein